MQSPGVEHSATVACILSPKADNRFLRPDLDFKDLPNAHSLHQRTFGRDKLGKMRSYKETPKHSEYWKAKTSFALVSGGLPDELRLRFHASIIELLG